LPNKISRQIEGLGCINDRENLITLSDFIDRHIHDNYEKIIEKKVLLNIPHLSRLPKIESLKFIFAGFIHGCTLLIPKIAFDTTGSFDETLVTTQDYDLWFRFIEAGYHFFYIPEVLIVSRKHTHQVSVKKIKIAEREQRKMFITYYKKFKKSMNKVEKNCMQNYIKKYKLPYIFIQKSKTIIKTLIPKSIMRHLKILLHKSS
jgi:GT2 family glycosyltransferase